MDTQLTKCIEVSERLLGTEATLFYHFSDLVLIGLAGEIIGDEVIKRVADTETCVSLARSVPDQKMQLLSNAVVAATTRNNYNDCRGQRQSSSLKTVEDNVRVQQEVLKAILSKVPKPRNKCLFVCVGSSADKLAMAFEYMNLHTHTVLFSRTVAEHFEFSGCDNGKLQKCAMQQHKKMKETVQNIRKTIIKPLRRALKESDASHIVLVDFVASGSTFMMLLQMLHTFDADVYEITHPLMIMSPNMTTLKSNLLRLNPRTIEIATDSEFYFFPKMFRCVPHVKNTGTTKTVLQTEPLNHGQYALCNAARIFYAKHILLPLRKTHTSSTSGGRENRGSETARPSRDPLRTRPAKARQS